MNTIIRKLQILITICVLAFFAFSSVEVQAEEVKTSSSSASSRKSGAKKTSKTKTSQPKMTAHKTKTTSKASSSKSKTKKKGDRIDKAAEASSEASKPAFTKQEIAKYEAMDFEVWESPREVSELGLPIEPGFAQPYPYGNLMRQYCTTNSKHKGHDIGAVDDGKNAGMGSPINSVARAVVTFVGRTGEDIGEFGKLDKRTGYAVRTGKSYPRQVLIPGYGLVYPFSLNYGRWRSGYVLVTKILDGPLKDYTVRYMHMGGIRPDLKPGSVVEAGEHIAIMGGTAVLDSYPHVHIDMSTPTGARANLSPFIGIPQDTPHCKSAAPARSSKSDKNAKKSSSKKATKSSLSKTAKTPVKSTKTSKSSNKSKRASLFPQLRSRSVYLARSTEMEEAQMRTLERQTI